MLSAEFCTESVKFNKSNTRIAPIVSDSNYMLFLKTLNKFVPDDILKWILLILRKQTNKQQQQKKKKKINK